MVRLTPDPTCISTTRDEVRLKPDATYEEVAPRSYVGSGFSRTSSRRYVQFPIGRRLLLDLGGPVDAGYQQVGDALRALPIGSTLDRAAGTFAWEPPAGFFGPFDLSFVRRAGLQACPRADLKVRTTTGCDTGHIDVTVTIVDGTRAPRPIAMHVDAPLEGSIVSGALTVGGWALDPQATTGSGIDAIDVWATRRDVAGAAAQFLGEATLGFFRPDVAAAYGAQFEATGFQITAPALPPGTYDITLYGWSHRAARWEDARVISLIVR